MTAASISPRQLAQTLAKQKTNLCVITGDVMVLVDQAKRVCWDQAQKDGFQDKIPISIQSTGDLAQIQSHISTPSLFSPKCWIDCTIHTKGLGKKGYDQLQVCCDSLGEHCRMTLSFPLIEHAQKKLKWFMKLTANALVIDCKDPTGPALTAWLKEYCKQHQLSLTDEQAQLLVAATEGNLSACAQEIKKLSLLAENGQIDADTLKQALSESTQFTVFQLVDDALAGDTPKLCRMLARLHQQALSPVLMLWSFVREIRNLIKIKVDMIQRKPWDAIARQHRLWSSRQAIVKNALQQHSIQQLLNLLDQSSQVERIIKGIKPGNAEQAIDSLFLQLAGQKLTSLQSNCL